MHELLMVDADGEDWLKRHAKLTKEFYNLWEEEREDLGDLPDECERIMRSYKRHYKDDALRYRVIDTELDEIVTLSNGVELRIIVDKVVEDLIEGGLWAIDYKTRAKFVSAEDMMIDPQLTLYFAGLEMLGYSPMRGAMYDEIRTKPPAIPETLKSGGLSKRRNIDTDVYTYMREIRRLDLDPSSYSDILTHVARNQKDRFFRRTPIPKDPPVVRTVMKEAMQTASEMVLAQRKNRFPRTFTSQCRWDCDYKDLCIVELYGGNPLPLIKMNYQKRSERARDA